MSVTRILCFGGCGFPMAFCNCLKKDDVVELYPKYDDYFKDHEVTKTVCAVEDDMTPAREK